MTERIFYVYEHWRPDKNECFYVGKGCGKRARNFTRGTNKRYRNIVQKLARNGLVPEVRLIAQGLAEEEALSLEMQTIAKYGRAQTAGGTLVNRTDGGDGPLGMVFTPKTIAKMSAAKKGKKRSADHCERMAIYMKNNNPFRGRTHTLETLAKISAASKRAWADPDYRVRISASVTEALRAPGVREKISAAGKGRIASAETRAKLMGNKSFLGRKLSAEHRANISATRSHEPRSDIVRLNISKALKRHWKRKKENKNCGFYLLDHVHKISAV